MGKKISDSMKYTLKEFDGMPILGRFWIKVNGLKQPFQLRSVYYQLLQNLPDVGSDNR